MQIFALIHCCMCGMNHEQELNIPPPPIVVPEEAVNAYIEHKTAWEYAPPTAEWMCASCARSPALFKVTDEILKKYEPMMQDNANKLTWAWDKLVKKEIMNQLGINPDLVTANEVEVKAYMNPHSLVCDFYINPVGMSWVDLKKRHPAKRSTKAGCLDGG